MESTNQPNSWGQKARKWLQQSAKWLQQQLDAWWRKFLQWLRFWAGLVLGTALAFLVYAALQPRIFAQVAENRKKADQAAVVAKEKARLDSVATIANAATAAKTASSPPAGKLVDTTSRVINKSDETPPAIGATNPSRRTRLTSLGPAEAPTARPVAPALLAALTMLVALTATVAAWQQKQRRPKPVGTISSPLLEALFTVPGHLAFLQKRLKLSPREIKRFSSKARIQHVQLQAAARPIKSTSGVVSPGLPFPVAHQLKAFQMLLLLEENRNAVYSISADDVDEFCRQLKLAHSADKDLRTAWDKALDNDKVKEAHAKEGSTTSPDFENTPDTLLHQIYELNAGLLT